MSDKDEFEEDVNQKEDSKKPNVVIIEKVVHSDYQKMFDDFNNNKFEAIKNKITGELKRLKENPPIEIPSVSDILNKM